MPAAVTSVPSASVAVSRPGAARTSWPWVTTRAGSPAAPISICRPQTPSVRPSSVTGVHGGITFSMLPRFVFHQAYLAARSSLVKELSLLTTALPSAPRQSNATVYLPGGNASNVIRALA